jgi:hypothetical protein
LLLLGSPLMLLMSVGAMNHSTTCLMLWLAAWGLMPEPRGVAPRPLRRDLAMTAVGGLALGWAMMTRPLTGLAHGMIWGMTWLALLAEALWWRAPERVRPGRLLARLGAALAGLTLPALIFLFYNRATTGHALRLGYQASNPLLHRLGFHGAGTGALRYMPLDALNNLASDLMSLNRAMLGLAIGSWTLLLVWWLRTRLPRHHVILAGLVLMQLLLYKLYQFHDLFFGPRFLFEALPGLALLAGAGLALALRGGGLRAGAAFAALGILTVGAACEGIDAWAVKFNGIAGDHLKVQRFVESVLPVDRPTVLVVPHRYEEMVGRWFPASPGSPPLWFVVQEKLAAARALPELDGYQWFTFSESLERIDPVTERSRQKGLTKK